MESGSLSTQDPSVADEVLFYGFGDHFGTALCDAHSHTIGQSFQELFDTFDDLGLTR